MMFVYIVISGECNRILGVFANENDATCQVNMNACSVWDINPKAEPPDFDGALVRYGWADRIWWQKEVLYD